MTLEVFTSDLTKQKMEQAAGYRLPAPLAISPHRARIARQTQDYIEKHYDLAVRIEDLCLVTGVGVRTLQRCFKENFNVTITKYLKSVRLDAAYVELNASDPVGCTVAAIALRHGFTHLGRFSVEFREHYGQTPSATLVTQNSR